jgi:WD40 repeat protein
MRRTIVLLLILAACKTTAAPALEPQKTGLLTSLAADGVVYLSCAFSPNGKHLAAGTNKGPVFVFEVGTWKPLFQIEGHAGGTGAVVYSPDGSLFMSGGADGKIRVWRDQECRVIQAHEGMIWALAFSADGRWLASSGTDSKTRVWQEGRLVATVEGTQADHNSLAFYRNMLVTCGQDGSIRRFDVERSEELTPLSQGRPISSIVLAGGTAYGSSMDGVMELWYLDASEKGNDYGATGARFVVPMAPMDGYLILGDGPVLRIINALTGKRMTSFRSHQAPITSLAVSRAGHIATLSADGAFFVWGAGGAIPKRPGWAGVATDGVTCKILQVIPGSAAEKGGLAKDDVIVKVGNTAVAKHDELVRALSSRWEGDEVTVVAWREGKEVLITLKLGARPEE